MTLSMISGLLLSIESAESSKVSRTEGFVDQLNAQDTGFDFTPPGPERDHAIGEAESEIRRYPPLQVPWTSVPLRSTVTLDQAG
jgi:hypothetical protein